MELKKHPKALTINEQIENLEALNLKMEDKEFAAHFLNDVSYFRFIKAYSLGLKPKNGLYYDGVTFEQLVELYLFNANFRQLLFAQIEKVEINLRCRVSNHFSSAYGVLGYKDSSNFADKDYALVEIFSFGTLSKFFKNMKSSDKKVVAGTYGVSYVYFESWIESIAYVRNLCAHYGRLYNAKLTKTPKLYSHDRMLGTANICIFGILVCLKYILPPDRHWIEFVDLLWDELRRQNE